MASNRSRSSRGLCGLAVALWALLATAAALEEYDEVPPDVDNATYQEDNSLYTGSMMTRDGPDLALAKDVLLYKLIRSLRGAPSYKPRIRWLPEYNEHRKSPLLEDMSDKDAIVKRLTDALRARERDIGFKPLEPAYRPQQKWKIKKGSQMVCYFKLCAFRSPL